MKLVTYAPDVDPIEDGALLECNQIIPTIRGIGAAPGAVAVFATVVAATVIGGASLSKLSGDTRTFVGTPTKLYEQAGAAWTDVSEGGGSYTTVNARWNFSQFGDVSLAIAKENVLQYSNGSGAFAKVTSTATGSTVTAPAAAVMDIVGDFVLLGNTTGVPGYTADSGDRWACAALGDYADWTPDIATNAYTGRVTSVPGKITAIRKFGEQAVIFKEKGMYLGTFAGPPVGWAFPEIPTSNTGTFCQQSAIQIGTPEQPLLFFVGNDDFYLFDGARPIPVGFGVKERFFSELDIANADKIICLHNRAKSLVYIHYPSSTSLTECLVFNYRAKRWGRDDRTIEFAFEYIAPGTTYDDISAIASITTYDTLPESIYDTIFIGAKTPQPGIFNTSHRLYTLTGSGGVATLTTHHIGDDDLITNVSRVTPRWITKPDDGSMVNYYWMSSGETAITGTTVTMGSGRFDLLRSAGWHKFDFTFTGDWELNEVKVDMRIDGRE
jgi:hypothetical protein